MKQYEKAVDVFQKGLKIDPNYADLYSELGLAYLSEKKPAEAKSAFKAAVKIDPRHADAIAGLGAVAILNQQYNLANKLIATSLALDSDDIVALSALGNLRMIEKNYPEAVKAYQQLMTLQPNEKWIKLLYENAKNGPELDEIKQLIENEQFSEAARRYGDLIALYPENPYYYSGQGLMYLRLKQYSNAIDTFIKGLKSSPDENELLVSLGYGYLLNKDLEQAKTVLSQALERDKKDAEAIAGLGRVYALEDDDYEAEILYRQALAINPTNESALSFYSALLLKQKRYGDALEILTQLKQRMPNAQWVQRAIQDAEDGPMMDQARYFANCEDFETAIILYWQLVENSPEDPARYQNLGQMYANLYLYYDAICIYEQGLMFDPDALYLWRSIAFAYIQLADYNTATDILMYVLSEDNQDAEAWAGLGRIEALHGSPCCAESYYETALSIDVKNMTAIAYLADLRREQQYNFTGLELYATLMGIDSDPKWVEVGYRSFLDLTCPTLNVVGAYHQEIEWDPTVDRWSAQYEVYGVSALLNYPISDYLTLWGRCEDEFYILRDLLSHQTIYSFDVQRVAIGGRWIYSPCFYIDTKAGICDFSGYSNCTTFRLQKGSIAESALTFTYHQPREKATLNFSEDADLIARHFQTNLAKLVGRYIISGTYEREIAKRTIIGLEGDLYWYRDYVHNRSERASGVLQWRPPWHPENIVFKYFTKYQSFAKNIPDYYTYKFQVVNLLQMTLEKSWRVCWADYLYTSLTYGHGWQDTRTRFPEIIVLNPVTNQPALVWDDRQYDILTANLIYRCDQLQLSLSGDFYQDTEKYTMWSLIAGARWRF
jgi:tetratricopeptide (TPR) repeat protein